jgi:CubicO group peptidase (beta-lactamase class C family)
MTVVDKGEPARRMLAGVLMISAIGLSAVPRPAWSWSEHDIAPIAQISMDAEVAPRTTPGVTASITFRDGVHWSGASGYADKDNKRKLVAADQMRIGSQTKTYTGTVILQMIEEGKLSLDDTLSKWLPNSGVPQAGQITIRNLLDMTSGIPDYLDTPAAGLSGTCPAASSPRGPTVLDQWVVLGGMMPATPAQLIAASNCNASGGLGKMSYSNTNFVILGSIAEKIACGDSPPPNCFIDELKRRVLSRVPGLNSTVFPTNPDFSHPTFSGGYARVVKKNKVTGMESLLDPDADAYLDFTRVDPTVPWTAGAMISNADDETIWASQLAGNQFQLLSPDMQHKRLTDIVNGNVAGVRAQYGLAVYYMRSLLNNANMVGHSGSIPGYTSNVSRRTDNDTDYGANVATFTLADNFTAPTLVWVLDRNVWGAINSTGNCGAAAAAKTPAPRDLTCNGDSVRLSSLAVGHALTLEPSGKSYDTYVPAPPPPINSTIVIVAPILTRKAPVPTIAFYGHHQSALALSGSAMLKIEPDAALAMVGNQSAAISLKGSRNTVSIGGSVTAWGRDVAGLRDAGGDNTIAIGGQVSGSAVWWNPDLPYYGIPSVDMVAVLNDTSAAVDLAGSNGKLTVDGTVQTQRIKTAAVQVRPQGRGYTLSIGPKGAVVGPIVLAGTRTSLSIATGGIGLYVLESRTLAPTAAKLTASVATSGEWNFALRDLPPIPASPLFVASGVPGIPPIPRPAIVAARLTPDKLLSKSAPLPAMLVLRGSDNTATIDGTLIGAIPKDFQSGYTLNVVAVDDKGIGNALNIGPRGTVIGDILLHGQRTHVRLDGTAKGNVTVTGSSIVVEGKGRIEGKLTINGTAVSQLSNLKFGPAQ